MDQAPITNNDHVFHFYRTIHALNVAPSDFTHEKKVQNKILNTTQVKLYSILNQESPIEIENSSIRAKTGYILHENNYGVYFWLLSDLFIKFFQ